MPRPFKQRYLGFTPATTFFKPQGIPLRMLEITTLEKDEVEAIRLADNEGLYHDVAAGKMNISRQTFGNIIKSARKKVADAIINGKAIAIAAEEKEHIVYRGGNRMRGLGRQCRRGQNR